jgi:hypothetical protein
VSSAFWIAASPHRGGLYGSNLSNRPGYRLPGTPRTFVLTFPILHGHYSGTIVASALNPVSPVVRVWTSKNTP